MTFAYSTLGTTDRLLSGILQQTPPPTSSRRSSASCRRRTSASSGCSAPTTRTRIPASIRRISWQSRPAPTTCAEDIPPLAVISLDSTYKEIALVRERDLAHHAEVRSVLRRPLERQRPDAEQNIRIELPTFLFPPGVVEQNFDNLKSSESPFTWSVSPRYEFTDTTSIYVRVATGFRPGGPNVLPPGSGAPSTYDSDELTNYEIGLRTGTADGTFTLDVAAFYLDWKDIQLFQVVNGVRRQCERRQGEEQGPGIHGDSPGGPGLHDLAQWRLHRCRPHRGHRSCSSAASMATRCPGCRTGVSDSARDYEWAVLSDVEAYVGGLIAYTGERTDGLREPHAGRPAPVRGRATRPSTCGPGSTGPLVDRALRQERDGRSRASPTFDPAGSTSRTVPPESP